jgi:TonB family protein
MRRAWKTVLLATVVVACNRGGTSDDAPEQAVGFEPPVVTNASAPVEYPAELFERGVEGTVLLHLFVDAEGSVVPDSTRIAEGSGEAALDSAAIAGVVFMEFAPARRDGVPVATSFLQPVHFRQPSRAGEPND